jgi:V/A-type H+-transporting ATPase subunit D
VAMALRAPPGRAGRLWLVARLEIARRGAELLDRKRRALLRERRRVRGEVEVAQEAWRQADARAAAWSARAAILDGAARLELLARHAGEPASLELSWTNLMGARLPTIESLTVPDPPPLSALGGSSAAAFAARACADAAVAAARYAIARRAELELSVELRRASRRLRALQERWIPQHEAALAQLDLVLDENQREQAARARWATGRRHTASM